MMHKAAFVGRLEKQHHARSWILIPARGGSVGIPRKNLVLCAGQPLIQHSIETALRAADEGCVVVVTDDEEIKAFAERFPVNIILEDDRAGPLETLDDKIIRNIPRLRDIGVRDDDYLLTLQPTAPLTSTETVSACVRKLESGYRSVLTVCEDRHLTWRIDESSGEPVPNFATRENRQALSPALKETGGVIGARFGEIDAEGTRVIQPVGLVTVPESEAVDIDGFGDLSEAEHWLTKSRICIRVDAGKMKGMGHLYRGLAVAYELARHEIEFVVGGDPALSARILENTPFRFFELESDADFFSYLSNFQPDLLVLDILDTPLDFVGDLRGAAPGAKILTFENEGPGVELCDVAVYDLTPEPEFKAETVLSGEKYALLAPTFELLGPVATESTRQKDLLVSFGGTDPANLTERTLGALQSMRYGGSVTVVTGIGSDFQDPGRFDLDLEFVSNVENMAALMVRHCAAISSMGRTVFELASLNVPTLCFGQNGKEMTHIHVGPQTGSVDGGPGFSLTDRQMEEAIGNFLSDPLLHESLRLSSHQFRLNRNNRSNLRRFLSEIDLKKLI